MADDDDDDAGGSGSELGADEVAAGGTPSRRTDARTQKDREAIIITEAPARPGFELEVGGAIGVGN